MPDYASCQAHLAGALALCGDLRGARAALAAMPARRAGAPGNDLSPYVMAIVALRLGDAGLALERLQTAADIADRNILWAPIDPCLAPFCAATPASRA